MLWDGSFNVLRDYQKLILENMYNFLVCDKNTKENKTDHPSALIELTI